MALVSILDYERRATELLPRNALDYYSSGAGDEFTLRLNRTAFQKYRIRPRCLRDVSNRSTKCTILGCDVNFPIGIAPTAMQKMANAEGERASARAAAKLGTVFTLSTIATSSVEEVAEQAPGVLKWLQLYIYKDRELTKRLIRRAEAAGYKAIALTVDAPFFGKRRADVRNKFQLPSHLGLANFEGDKASGVKSQDGGSGLNEYVSKQFDASVSWEDVKWLIKFTKLPVVLKGILTVEDALLAIEVGAQGIVVSNHGARQVDGVPASIEALPAIADAVAGRLPIIMDGGISDGVDVFKALALGANFVLIGRPVLWGLTVNGQKGVEDVLGILQDELDTTMAMCGTPTIKDINRNYIVHESSFSKL